MVFKFKKPVLRIFFGDGVVVGDTKVFKPGAVHTVGGLELHGSIRVQEYRGIGGKNAAGIINLSRLLKFDFDK